MEDLRRAQIQAELSIIQSNLLLFPLPYFSIYCKRASTLNSSTDRRRFRPIIFAQCGLDFYVVIVILLIQCQYGASRTTSGFLRTVGLRHIPQHDPPERWVFTLPLGCNVGQNRRVNVASTRSRCRSGCSNVYFDILIRTLISRPRVPG